MNVSVSEMVTATAQDVFINARDTVDASATDLSLGAGDTLDVVAQNKASVLTTDFWLAAGHALDVFAQVSCHRWQAQCSRSAETNAPTCAGGRVYICRQGYDQDERLRGDVHVHCESVRQQLRERLRCERNEPC